MTREELLQTAKPILFNTDMVRAILDDRKSATRRVIKFKKMRFTHTIPKPDYIKLRSFDIDVADFRINPLYSLKMKSRYKVGDILYVRETWAKLDKHNKYYYRADSICNGKSTEWGCPDAYDRSINCNLCEFADGYIKWRPNIHMPKEVARIFLRVTDVRAERLQDITEQQAEAEGIKSYWAEPHRDVPPFSGNGINYRHNRVGAFEQLWNSTIKKKT